MMQEQVEILLVEDNPYDAELSLRALRHNNIANCVVHVSDGEEALDFLLAKGKYKDYSSNRFPRLILLDLNLPRISGLEVLKILKSDSALKNIPVVVLTTSKEENDIIQSYNLGVNSYLVKPVSFDNFVNIIKELGFYWLILNQAPK
jgi:two-component system, response regulator